jgi:hypothetical protein
VAGRGIHQPAGVDSGGPAGQVSDTDSAPRRGQRRRIIHHPDDGAESVPAGDDIRGAAAGKRNGNMHRASKHKPGWRHRRGSIRFRRLIRLAFKSALLGSAGSGSGSLANGPEEMKKANPEDEALKKSAEEIRKREPNAPVIKIPKPPEK